MLVNPCRYYFSLQNDTDNGDDNDNNDDDDNDNKNDDNNNDDDNKMNDNNDIDDDDDNNVIIFIMNTPCEVYLYIIFKVCQGLSSLVNLKLRSTFLHCS